MMRRLAFLALAACRGGAVPVAENPAPVVDVSAELGPDRSARAFVVADLDGDGRPEIVVEREGGIGALGASPAATGKLLAACDLDGDGKAEIVSRHGADLVAGSRRVAGAGADLAVCVPRGVLTAAGPKLAWWEVAGPTLVDRAGELGLVTESTPVALLATPLLGAGTDVVALIDDGGNLFFAAQPDGRFRELGRTLGIDDLAEKRRVAVVAIDLDGDGARDLALANRGRSKLFVQRGGGFLDLSAPPWTEPTAGGPLVAADLDGDGTTEIYAAPGRLFTLRQGLTVPIDPGSLAGATEITSAAAADLDSDGRPEIITLVGDTLSLHRAVARPR
jgi:FG-GAP-like repeat